MLHNNFLNQEYDPDLSLFLPRKTVKNRELIFMRRKSVISFAHKLILTISNCLL